MVRLRWGRDGQLQFSNVEEYYKVLGALCNNSAFTITFEANTVTNSWGDAYRIHCLVDYNALLNPLKNAARNKNRINCNDYIINLKENHNFIFDANSKKLYGNYDDVIKTVPIEYRAAFNDGYNMY